MQLFCTSSKGIGSIIDNLIPKYKEIGINIVHTSKEADIIVSDDNLEHIQNTNAQICIMMGNDIRFKKCINLLKTPRTGSLQLMDTLSSFAYMLGYQAAIIAINNIDRILFSTNITGTIIESAKVLVIGTGVAGLSAIATLRRIGTQVCGIDINDNMKESVESFGAEFKLSNDLNIIDYEPDIIITSAGKNIILIKRNILDMFKKKCLIIDISNNCEISVDAEIYHYNNVTIIGAYTIRKFQKQMTEIYSNNIYHLLKLYIEKSPLIEPMIENNL